MGKALDSQTISRLAWNLATLSQVDSIKRLLLGLRGYEKLATIFVNGSTEVRTAILKPLRNMLVYGPEVRSQIAQGHPKLMEALVALATADSSSLTRVAGVILALGPMLPDAAEPVKAANKILLSAFKGFNQEMRHSAWDCLTDDAGMPEVRPILLEIGVKELVQPYADDSKSEANFSAVLIIALLSASDVSANTETGTKPTAPGIIRRIIEALDTFCTGSEVVFPTLPGFSIHCGMLFLALRSLATNEANQKELKNQNVAAVLKKLLKARRQNLFLDNTDPLVEVSRSSASLSPPPLTGSDLSPLPSNPPTGHVRCLGTFVRQGLPRAAHWRRDG